MLTQLRKQEHKFITLIKRRKRHSTYVNNDDPGQRFLIIATTGFQLPLPIFTKWPGVQQRQDHSGLCFNLNSHLYLRLVSIYQFPFLVCSDRSLSPPSPRSSSLLSSSLYPRLSGGRVSCSLVTPTIIYSRIFVVINFPLVLRIVAREHIALD